MYPARKNISVLIAKISPRKTQKNRKSTKINSRKNFVPHATLFFIFILAHVPLRFVTFPCIFCFVLNHSIPLGYTGKKIKSMTTILKKEVGEILYSVQKLVLMELE